MSAQKSKTKAIAPAPQATRRHKSRDGLFHSMVQGLNPLGDFIEKQALLQFAMKHRGEFEQAANERARLVQETFWAFHDKAEKGRKTDKLTEAFLAWKGSFLRYLGFDEASGFVGKTIELSAHASLPLVASASHSCGLLNIASLQAPEIEIDDSIEISSLPGADVKARDLRKTTLAELSDQILKNGEGLTDLLVLTMTKLYWFSADVVTYGACLECDLGELFQPDEEHRLAFLQYLLGESAFRKTVTEDAPNGEEGDPEEEAEATENEDEDEDEDQESLGAPGASSPSITTRAQKLLQDDLESKRQITEELHQQVTIALEILVNHRLALDPLTQARSRNKDKALAEQSHAIFKDSLFFVYRMLFVLFSESKGILELTLKEYASFYSMQAILDWCDAYPRNVRAGRVNPDGHYIWESLMAIFTLLRRGVDLKGEKRIPAFNGQLFAPDQCSLYDHGPKLSDRVLVQVLTHLTTREVSGYRERVNFGNLEIGQLGVVYEALLAQRPKYLPEDHVWVEAHGGGLGLVPRSWVKALGGPLEYLLIDTEHLRAAVDFDSLPKSAVSKMKWRDFESRIHPGRPARRPAAGTFVICPSGGAKRQTASFYTPQRLADYLANRTLKPLIEKAKTPEEILKITVLEPSVGCGSFLVSAMKILARALIDRVKRDERAASKICGGVFGNKSEIDSDASFAQAKRLVLENCLFGVDTNGLSLELCRVILYLESITVDRPLPFLHHKLKQGNALMGADLRGRFAQKFGSEQIINWAFVPSLAVFKTQKEFLKEKNKDPSIYGAYAEAAALHGIKVPNLEQASEALSKAEDAFKAARKGLFTGTKGVETPETSYLKRTEKLQKAIDSLLAQVADLERRFTKLQQQAGGVDRQNDLFQDFANMLPESDPLLIEAENVAVEDDLKMLRKESLQREFGVRVYKSLVLGARATQRLRAFANYASALQTWPLDLMHKYPSFEDYLDTAEILLTADLKNPLAPETLSRKQFASLRAALETAKRMVFFHADLEFASVMEEGFSAVLGNPPWKVVGAKDKGVFPAFDPAFMTTAKNKKRERRSNVATLSPEMDTAWWKAHHDMQCVAQFWQNQKDSREEPLLAHAYGEGQLDLCTLFLLRTEGLLQPGGYAGYIVSHSATFVTKNTRPLRERFFKEWGLKEATVFENRAKIFDIASYITFATLVGSPKQTKDEGKPSFIQGVTALADLNGCENSFDGVSQVHENHHRIEIGRSLIERIFSPEVFAIPLIKDPREIRIAEELLKPRPGLVKVGDVVEVMSGIHSTSGPKQGLSIYREDLAKHGYKVPSYEEMFDPESPLIPLYKGSFFSHFDPYYLGYGRDQLYHDPEAKKRAWCDQIEQFGVREKLYQNPKTKKFIEREKIAWRGVSNVLNQRTLICAILPTNCIANSNCHLAVTNGMHNLRELNICLSSILSDLFIRYQVSAKVTEKVMMPLLVDLGRSRHFEMAIEFSLQLASPTEEQRVNFECEMIMHYARYSPELKVEDIIFTIENSFSAMCRTSPDFFRVLVDRLTSAWNNRDIQA